MIPRGAINCSCSKKLKLFLMTEHFHMYQKWIISIPNESLEKMVSFFFIWWSVQRTNRTGLLAEPLETHPRAPRMHCVTGSIPQRALGDPLMRLKEEKWEDDLLGQLWHFIAVNLLRSGGIMFAHFKSNKLQQLSHGCVWLQVSLFILFWWNNKYRIVPAMEYY